LADQFLTTRFRNDRSSNTRQLVDSLKLLRVRVERTLEAVNRGEQVDEHLVANHSLLTALLAKHNLFADYEPYIEGSEK